MIKSGRNGLLVPLNDVEGLAGGLKRLVQDELLRKGMGREAQHLREQFSGQRVNALWFKAFGVLGATDGNLSLER